MIMSRTLQRLAISKMTMNNGTTIPTAAALRAYATNDKFAAKVSVAHYFVRRLSKNVWLFLLSIYAKKSDPLSCFLKPIRKK